MGREWEDQTPVQTMMEKKKYHFTKRFVGRIVPYHQVGMVQCLLAADPLGRVKAQHLGEQVDSEGISMGVQGCKGYSWFDG